MIDINDPIESNLHIFFILINNYGLLEILKKKILTNVDLKEIFLTMEY